MLRVFTFILYCELFGLLTSHRFYIRVTNQPYTSFFFYPQQSIQVSVTDPQNSAMLTRSFEKEGKFAFTSQIGGEHKVCFSLNASRWTAGGTKLRLDLKFDVGEMGIDYGEVAKKEHLSELEVEVRRLNDKLKDIMKEQNYQREREVAFRNASELTNSRVATWSVIQVLVMAVSSFFGVNALRSFFQSKKLQ